MVAEATVSRSLAYLFLLSRFTGGAPVYINSNGNNRYRVILAPNDSCFQYLYFAVSCLAVIGAILSESYVFFIHQPSRKWWPYKSVDFTIGILGIIFAVTNSRRITKCFIQYINETNDITSKIINDYDRSNSEERRLSIILIGSICFFILSSLVHFVKQFSSDYNLTDIFLAIILFMYTTFMLLVMQIIVVNYDLYNVFRIIKRRLVELLDETRKETSSSSLDIKLQRVRTLTTSYISLCDVMEQMNQASGKAIFIAIASFVIIIMFYLCNILTYFYDKNGINYFKINSSYTCICYYCFEIYLIIKPVHLITKESNEVDIYLASLMYELTTEGSRSTWHWDVVYMQLGQCRPELRALDMFPINNSLIMKNIL
ncbi:uncharacterized protein LOC116777728 isoform X2 [Danaus plexippus]|uniref:uncharacterized protein LOC116777728 isoform X2 n=1 Tax=Danaus plexippus TaxID=13037 RepID=UPI002AB2AFF8|nr:uncharacterized protein LOC116777728 isoform X2 [Danaus plexippus]